MNYYIIDILLRAIRVHGQTRRDGKQNISIFLID